MEGAPRTPAATEARAWRIAVRQAMTGSPCDWRIQSCTNPNCPCSWSSTGRMGAFSQGERLMKRIVVLLAAMSLSALPSLAQNPRSFVATTGNDANTCTRNNECRTFARALAVTNAGGEVIAIDSGGFGPFYVSQAVTVAAA